MSDVEWDDDSFEPPSRIPIMTDRWAGEDEEADVKDNWDDDRDDDDDQEKPTDNGESAAGSQARKKKPLKERIAEKQEKKRLEQEQKKKEQEEAAANLSPEELSAQKAWTKKLQEESDLLLAMDTFGVNDNKIGRIDGMEPSSKEDFDKFEELLRKKITKYEKSPNYVSFLENLFRQVCLDLEAEDIKRLGSVLTTLSNEKAKQQKATKGKKKKTKASLIVGKDVDDVLADTGDYDDYDDLL